MDIENAREIAAVQLQDAQDDLARSSTEAKSAILSDRIAALEILMSDYDNERTRRSDARIQQSIYRAMLSDFPAVEGVLAEDNEPGPEDAGPMDEAVKDGAAGYYDDDRVDPSGTTDLVEYVNRLRLDETNPQRECYVCLDSALFSRTLEVGPCSHIWCHHCLLAAINLAIINENNYPVRCCKDTPEIALGPANVSMVNVVGIRLIEKLNDKRVEYETEDRVYCPEQTCSTFIPPDTIIERMAICSSCLHQTCADCKLAYHGDELCENVVDEDLENWRRENNAATCPRCRRTVIIAHGCNHMTCHCAAEFCYECNAVWKTCACELWREDRLMQRAVEIAERRDEAENVEIIMEEIRGEPECPHAHWARVDTSHLHGVERHSRGRCNDCKSIPGAWLWQCDRCDMRVCRRCRQDYE